MKITEFSVRNPQFTVLMFIALVGLGVLSFLSIPKAEDPDLQYPGVIILVQMPGGNQKDIEQQIARPLEEAIKELDRVAKLVTHIQDGVCFTTIDFEFGSDPDRKYEETLRQVNSVRPLLPTAITEIEVRRWRTSDVALLQVALISDEASYARLAELADDLRKRLERVAGVRRSKRSAYPEKQVRVSLDIDRLNTQHIPLGRVLEAIAGDNLSIPGGAVELGERRFNLRTSGYYNSLEQIRDTPIRGSEAAVVRLGDLAQVSWDYEDKEYFARYNGKRALWVTAQPKDGADILQVREKLSAALENFRSLLPGDVTLEIAFDQAVNVRERLTSLLRDFLLSLGLVILTVLPLGLRASLLVSISIPLSLALGVTALLYTGFTLNQLSIVGLVIALGLLVDDSIVVVENIARFRRLGHGPMEAAIQGTKQISEAVLGTTFTLLFAFLPLLALPGGSGMFIRSMPVAVVYTVLASLFVALTIMPFLASRVMRGKEPPDGNFLLRTLQKGIQLSYRPLLRWCMLHRKSTLVAAALLFLSSLGLVPLIGFSLFPAAGIPQFLVQMDLPEGTGIKATDTFVRLVEERLSKFETLQSLQTNIGKGNPQVYYNTPQTNQRSNFAEILGTFKSYDPKQLPQELARMRQALSALPGAIITVREFEQGPLIVAPIEVRLFGDDLEELSRLSSEVEKILTQIPGTDSIKNPLRVPRTDLQLQIDRSKAALLGVPLAEIDRVARFGVSGLLATRYIDDKGDAYGIRVMVPRGERGDLSHWNRLHAQATNGALVPLGQFTRLEFTQTPNRITRFDRQRYSSVTARVLPGYNTGRITEEAQRRLHELRLPPGFQLRFGGEAESGRESFGGLASAILVACFGVLAVLVLEFRSFRGTLIVASVLPLGVIGGLCALFMGGYSLSFVATIGFIALIGIEIKNSILLVDFTNQLRKQGVPLHEAIEQAGEVRFLPVVLTTLTAIGALVPVAIEGSANFAPIAYVIIGGLISSLLLSRLVTPVMYSLIPPPSGTDSKAS